MNIFPKLYTDFAKYYDRLESQYRDYEKESRWLQSIFLEARSKHLIDISCGTGRHVQGIIGQGEIRERDYVAMDASREMIGICRDHFNLNIVRLGCGDFLEIPFRADSFDSAICMYWSLAGLEHGQVKRLFREVHRILEPGGIFVFDVENAEGIKENLLNEPFIDAFFVDPEANSTIMRANLSRKIEKDVVDWHSYYLIEKEGVSELVNDQMKLRFYSRSTLEPFLSAAGFTSIQVTSSPGGEYAQGSPSLYFVARKSSIP